MMSCNKKKGENDDFEAVFSLLTHEEENGMRKILQKNKKQLQSLVNILLKAIDFENSLEIVHETTTKTNNFKYLDLLAKFSFALYYNHSAFDILDWKKHMENISKEQNQTSVLRKTKNLENELKFMITRHFCQLHTNTQAVFCNIPFKSNPSGGYLSLFIYSSLISFLLN